MSSFKRGDQVEVCCKDEGFRNSFYPATIISEINTNLYIVQYNTLLTEDELHPHREFLSAVDLRPVPPVIEFDRFDHKNEVDAYVNDGWWKGKVTKKLIGKEKAKGMRYYVTFEGNGEVEVGKYWSHELRVHQDCVNGMTMSSDPGTYYYFTRLEDAADIKSH